MLDDMGLKFERASEAYRAGVAGGEGQMFRRIKAKIEKLAWDLELAGKDEELKICVKVIAEINKLAPSPSHV